MKKLILLLMLIISINVFSQTDITVARDTTCPLLATYDNKAFLGCTELTDSADIATVHKILIYIRNINKVFTVSNEEGETAKCEFDICMLNRHTFKNTLKKVYKVEKDSVSVSYEWVSVDSIPYYYSHYDNNLGTFVLTYKIPNQ